MASTCYFYRPILAKNNHKGVTKYEDNRKKVSYPGCFCIDKRFYSSIYKQLETLKSILFRYC